MSSIWGLHNTAFERTARRLSRRLQTHAARQAGAGVQRER